MNQIVRQLERDSSFMKVLPYADHCAHTYAIDETEVNRISNNLAQAAREIQRLEQECDRYRKHNALNERIDSFFAHENTNER